MGHVALDEEVDLTINVEKPVDRIVVCAPFQALAIHNGLEFAPVDAITRDGQGDEADAIAVRTIGRAQIDWEKTEQTEPHLVIDRIKVSGCHVDVARPSVVVAFDLEPMKGAIRPTRVRPVGAGSLDEAAPVLAQV
eukprot:7042611-Prymnesium_polylepis.2